MLLELALVVPFVVDVRLWLDVDETVEVLVPLVLISLLLVRLLIVEDTVWLVTDVNVMAEV